MARPYVDPAHEETEAVLKKIENRIKREYEQAMKEIEEKTADYLRRFEIKDKKWQEWVASGQKTAKEYEQWRIGQMIVGKQWKEKQDSLARDLVNASVTAKKITKENMPEVYAINFNYGTYEAEKGAGVDTNFTLYNKDAVARIVNEDPQILPEPGKKVSKAIAEGKAMRWDKQQIQSVMMQGILQGESIPHLAKRLATKVCDSDYKAAIRNARTMTTGVQNAGRMDAFKRADAKGIDMIQMWQAVFDNRTRHEHRILDGQKRPVGEPFEVEGEKIMYPGDPTAPAHLVYNCRCTLQGLVKGLNDEDEDVRSNSAVGGMSYEEWKAEHKSESRPITYQSDVGEAIAESYRREYNDNKYFGVMRKSSNDFDLDDYRSYGFTDALNELKTNDVKYNPPQLLRDGITESEIIRKLGGEDDGGHCTSLALAYAGNKLGYDVRDNRNDYSAVIFQKPEFIKEIAHMANGTIINGINDFEKYDKLKKLIKPDNEYILSIGRHTAVVRKAKRGYEYLELQDKYQKRFKPINPKVLQKTFGCREKRIKLGITLNMDAELIDINELKGKERFVEILGYINNTGEK